MTTQGMGQGGPSAQVQTPSGSMARQRPNAGRQPLETEKGNGNGGVMMGGTTAGGGQGQGNESALRTAARTMTQMRFHAERCFAIGYDPYTEKLEYDYTYDSAAHGGKPQRQPRLPTKGSYYIDSYNGQPWACAFGTHEDNGIWMNSGDQAGLIMSTLVWVLMLYSAVTVTLLAATEGIPVSLGMLYCTLCFLALACHAKTSLTDPGSVPRSAVPCEAQRQMHASHSMCGQCQTFKPPQSHHCRICNRCVSRMDHHCPWMNNCVGAANLSEYKNGTAAD